MSKSFIKALIMGCIAISMVGCGVKGGNNPSVDTSVDTSEKTSTAAPEKQEVTKIQFMHSYVEQDRQVVIQELIDAFETQNPNIKVEQVPVDEDAYETKIVALGGSGELPELMEMGQDFAKSNAKNQFIDFDAVQGVISNVGEDNFYKAVLDVIKTEDGSSYIGIPMSGFVQGIWYNKELLAEKGFEGPSTWDEILEVAKAFYNKNERKYGIALATADSTFTEQVFSQFALSNNANVLDEQGNATFNTPEMKETLAYYKELAQYTMPGSNDVPEVKDAFMNGSAPMALYSTYILPAVYEAGESEKLGFTIPTNKHGSAYGAVSVVTIAEGLEESKKDAAIKFASYLLEDNNNVKWLHMSPGGGQPILKTVANSDAYLNNDVIRSFAHINNDITSAFNQLEVFGSINGKNFLSMGEITRKGVIKSTINAITVNEVDIDKISEDAQKQIESIVR